MCTDHLNATKFQFISDMYYVVCYYFSELSRAFLCSFVLVCDLTILMQDWDFPHFTNTLDVNLPGFYKHMVTFQAVEIQISGINNVDSSLLTTSRVCVMDYISLNTIHYFKFRQMV